jgi:hypothetical protein
MTIESETEIEQPQISPVEDADASLDDDMQSPVFNRIDMQKVVNREKQKAFERGKREALMELQQQQGQQAPEQAAAAPVQQQAPQNIGGMQQLTSEQIEQMIAERAPQALQDHVNNLRVQQTVNSFVGKMQAAESKYPGLQERLNELDFSTAAPLVEMANGFDNTAEIMKELMDHPMKMGNLLSILQSQPKLAQKAVADLSQSIKANQDALAQEAQARDPLSQIKPSQNAGMDNSAMSVNDFKKMFRG